MLVCGKKRDEHLIELGSEAGMPEHDSLGIKMLSEEDLALVDAMQINPRIEWRQLGKVFQVDPSTVSRRWRRLTESGAAWTTVMPGPRQVSTMSVAYIEVLCEADHWRSVVRWLYDHPHVVTVQHLSGEGALWCSVFTPSEEVLSEFVVTVLPYVDGVRSFRTSIAMRVFDNSRMWRLNTLAKREVERIRPRASDTYSGHSFNEVDRQLFRILAVDARTPTSSISEQLSISHRSVQRRINHLANSGDIEFRCDLSRAQAGWHSAAILWLNAPEDMVEQVGKGLVSWNETRSCAATAGKANLMLTVALHSAKDLYSFALRLTNVYPCISIVDRQIVLRQYKLYGHMLSEAGRRVASSRVDPWFPSPVIPEP